MDKKKEQYRIGTLAQFLGVQRFVIRFWEKEFEIFPTRSHGGQRFYKQKDFEQFKLIKKLLYEQGFTIAGAKKILKEKDDVLHPHNKQTDEELVKKLHALQKKLIKFHKML